MTQIKNELSGIPAFSEISDEEQVTRMDALNKFFRWKRTLLAQNALAYSNTRPRSAPTTPEGTPTTVKKIFPGYLFVPCHPTRFVPGAGHGRTFNYFILHRPGGPVVRTAGGDARLLTRGEPGFAAVFEHTTRACSLRNTVFEFSHVNKPVATHFVLGLGGEEVQMVSLEDGARHIGGGRGVPNPIDSSLPRVSSSNSLGVELEGPITAPFTGAQLKACARLIKMCSDAFGIPITTKHILRHQDLSRDRLDPWHNFPLEAVLKMAAAYPRFSFPEAYQTVDILGSTARILTQAKNNAFSFSNTDNLTLSSILSRAAEVAVGSRAMRLAMQSRETLLQLQAATMQTAGSVIASAEAAFLSAIATLEDARPPEIKNAVLFDWNTLTWRLVS